MRKFLLHAVLTPLALLPLSLAQVAAPPPAMITYRSAAPAFTYVYPADLVVGPAFSAGFAKAMAGNGTDPEQVKFAKCSSVPVAVSKGIEGPSSTGIGLLILFQVDHTCLGVPGSPELLAQVAQQMTKMLTPFGQALTEDAKPYQLDGHPAAFVQGSVVATKLGDDTTLHLATACMLLGHHTVCWLLVDSNHKRMPALVANPIAIEGHAALPLIPADRVQAW